QKGERTDRFVVPSTRAVFELNEEKTRVHDLLGRAGIDFLGAVQQSFSVVTSERRAFLGNVERLEAEIEGVDLFSDGATGTDRIPRLRDADRFTLRRFIATAMVRGLERCALLLEPEEASSFLEQRTMRILSILDGNVKLEHFDLVLSLLKVALFCNNRTLGDRLRSWLDDCSRSVLTGYVKKVSWRGQELQTARALRALQTYLKRRIDEGIASACALVGTMVDGSLSKSIRNGALLHRTGLRRLDREDDVTLFGTLDCNLPATTRTEHGAARQSMKRDDQVSIRLGLIQSFIRLSNSLDERIWNRDADISLLLTTKPPWYVDVARRFLARAEFGRVTPEVGKEIEYCVDALRGTRYQGSRSASTTFET